MYLATIMKIPPVVVLGSEYERLVTMYPEATNIDGINRSFCAVLPDAVDPIIVDELVDGEGVKLAGDVLIAAIANILLSDDEDIRARAIHINSVDLQRAFLHPAYQLFSGNFMHFEDLKTVFLSFIGSELVADNFESGKAIARAAIVSHFNT